MATRSARDNKALNARHAETLKAMLRRPENKLCADCKKNDPRWASTNLGCFMCIRCSGIHRSMGVHITRIKSIDLDTWTPEQVANVQRWGNKKANAFWEAHLRPGHMPPDHKIESFIRSKYESRRWAMEGPIPEPETLDTESGETASEPLSNAPPAGLTASAAGRPPTALGKAPVVPAVSTSTNLLDAPPASSNRTDLGATGNENSTSKPEANVINSLSSSGNGGGLFDLDFSPSAASAAATATAPAARKDVKNDILSLFAAKPQAYGGINQHASQVNNLNTQFGGVNFQSGSGEQRPTNGSNGWDGLGALANNANHGQAQNGFSTFGTGSHAAQSLHNETFGGSADPWGVSINTAATQDLFGNFASGTNGTSNKSNDAFSDIWN